MYIFHRIHVDKMTLLERAEIPSIPPSNCTLDTGPDLCQNMFIINYIKLCLFRHNKLGAFQILDGRAVNSKTSNTRHYLVCVYHVVVVNDDRSNHIALI
jgi:hypothetical protein